MNITKCLAAITLCGTVLPVAPVAAQAYPTKPIRFVSSFPAGGPSDIITRTVARRMAEVMGQPVIVENRAGAAGHIGADNVARSAPDGYSLLLGGSFLTIGPSLMRKMAYNPDRDLTKIALIVLNQYILVTHPSVPAANVREFIKLAKGIPGKLNYASSGVGAPPHLAVELFNSMGGIKAVHIPYKGATPALADLVSGQVDYYVGGISGIVPFVQAGRLRALGVTGSKRSVGLPNVPTIAEAGLTGYEVATWFGVVGPAGMPQAVVRRLNEVVSKIAHEPEVTKLFISLGLEPATTTPEEFAESFRKEIPRFANIVKAAGLKPE